MSLAQTFQKLESVQAQRLQVSSGHASPYCYKDSQAHAARRKNRYSDIVPFDRNRVKLRDASNKAAGDYINASMIECSPQRRYIASQGKMLSEIESS
jgi:protein tyrosine phosphatase